MLETKITNFVLFGFQARITHQDIARHEGTIWAGICRYNLVEALLTVLELLNLSTIYIHQIISQCYCSCYSVIGEDMFVEPVEEKIHVFLIYVSIGGRRAKFILGKQNKTH